MSEWEKYTGSDEQIAEIRAAKDGYLLRSSYGTTKANTEIFASDLDDYLSTTSDYLINQPHPLAAEFIQWINTGQPVWWKSIEGGGVGICHEHFPPFAHPDAFEYSFTEFKEEV